jgi:acyl-CoA thioester hydrolase
MRREEFTFSHSLRVRWAEVDRQDVVFNGHYFLYFDVAVTEYWRATGFRYPEVLVAHGGDLFAVKATAEYHAPARYDDVLDVCCRVGRIGRSSMQMVLGIYRGAEHLTSGELVYVHVELASRAPAPLPEDLRSAVLAYEKTPPAQPAQGTRGE